MWKKKNNALHITVEANTFKDAKIFIQEILSLATKHNHHPTLQNTYTTIKLTLTTHDEGNTITQKDKDLAEKIRKIVDKRRSLHVA